jgi:hypothetical protein
MGNNIQNIDYVDLEDLKCFSMDDSAPRKNPQIFILPLKEKNALTEQHQYARSDSLGCKKICFIQRRIVLSCALKVQLGT